MAYTIVTTYDIETQQFYWVWLDGNSGNEGQVKIILATKSEKNGLTGAIVGPFATLSEAELAIGTDRCAAMFT